MKENTLPIPLLKKCAALINHTHKIQGFRGLASKITVKENMIALAFFPDMLVFMKNVSFLFKIRVFCWLLGIAIFILSWVFSWWLLFGLVVIFVIDRILVTYERQNLMGLSTHLLALEMLTSDFAGWGDAYPDETQQAFRILGEDAASHTSKWLDFYLPRREELSVSILRDFGPQKD